MYILYLQGGAGPGRTRTERKQNASRTQAGMADEGNWVSSVGMPDEGNWMSSVVLMDEGNWVGVADDGNWIYIYIYIYVYCIVFAGWGRPRKNADRTQAERKMNAINYAAVA